LDSDNILHFAYVQQGVVEPRVFLEDELIHFKVSNSKSFIYGKPLFLPQLIEIAANIQANRSIATWFEQGFTGGAIFKMEADPDVAQRNRDYIKEYFSRPENFGRTMLLEGSMDLIRDGNKFDGFDFSKLSDTNRDNIIIGAGIPLSQAGVRSAAGNANAEIVAAEEKAFIRNTVDMYHKLVYEKLNARLFRQILGWKDVVIQPGVPVKFSMTDAIETVRALAEIAITPNEARDLLSVQRVPDEKAGNTYITATNNGMIKTLDVIGIDPETGEEGETIFESQQAANQLKGGASGMGGPAKKAAEKSK
jgi:hypothetical protein